MNRIELVGILNLTPDSFSGDGIYHDPKIALHTADRLFEDGASFVDVGAESTRPGAVPIDEYEEWRRLKPVIEPLVAAYPGRISLDSRHPKIVRRVSESVGPIIVNDVTGFNNPEMVQVVADEGLKCIVSHFPGSFAQNVQAAHEAVKKIDNEAQVLEDLMQKRDELVAAGVEKSDIILDPGIGFGKTKELNKRLLRFGSLILDAKVMIGYSRKRFLGLNRMSLDVNLEAADIAVQHQAAYLRVHDVLGHARYLFTESSE